MSQPEIEIQIEVPAPEDAADMLTTAVEAVLVHEGVLGHPAVTVLLTDDGQLRQLNRDFRGYDQSTDVLSFPAGSPLPGTEAAGEPHYLGDIAISVPTARRQAESAGHSLTAELQLLAIHGVLHLLGHDHAEVEERQRMWAAQGTVLQQLEIAVLNPDYLS